MKHTSSPHDGSFTGTALFLVSLMGAAIIATTESGKGHAEQASITDVRVTAAAVPVPKGVQLTSRRAERLADRLHGAAPHTRDLVRALDERDKLMRQFVTVRLYDIDGTEIGHETLSVASNPTWIRLDVSDADAEAVLLPEHIALTLRRLTDAHVSAPSHCIVSGIREKQDERNYPKAETDDCIVRDGATFDVDDAVLAVMEALPSRGEVPIILRRAEGTLRNVSERDLGELTLMATGISNFAGSPWGRRMNIEKAFRDHLNNIIVEPGEVFSFNSTLGGPVSQSRGWHMALGIFGGGELRPTPGGGLCQASTNMFRVALDGGFPILEQASHSLYVHYYEKYGVGQDATIFPGYRDFRFLNDTAHPILIQAYTDGDDAIVHIYGTPDGRSSALHGPFFAQNAPEGLTHNGRALRNNEIAWVRTVRLPTGEMLEELFVSAYKSIPLSVRRQYTEQ